MSTEPPTDREIGLEMLEHMDAPDWGFVHGQGCVQFTVSAGQMIRWCDALGFPYPEGTEEAQKRAKHGD